MADPMRCGRKNCEMTTGSTPASERHWELGQLDHLTAPQGANSSLRGRHDKAARTAAGPQDALRGPLCGTEVAGGPSSPS